MDSGQAIAIALRHARSAGWQWRGRVTASRRRYPCVLGPLEWRVAARCAVEGAVEVLIDDETGTITSVSRRRAFKPWCVALVSLGATLILPMHARGGDIYRWVDAAGRTHMGEIVPQAYRSKAIRYDAARYEATPQQRSDAEARRQRDLDKLRGIANEREAAEQRAQAVQPAASATAQAAASTVPEDICAKLWRRYIDSYECFAPFMFGNRWGRGIKPEAFDVCGPAVPEPSQRCGPPPRE